MDRKTLFDNSYRHKVLSKSIVLLRLKIPLYRSGQKPRISRVSRIWYL